MKIEPITIEQYIEMEISELEAENNNPEKTEILKFCLALLQKKGTVCFYDLYSALMSDAQKQGISARMISQESGVSNNALSTYNQKKQVLRVDSYERVLNTIIKLSNEKTK